MRTKHGEGMMDNVAREIKFRGWDGEKKRMWSWHELQHTHFMASLYSHGDGSWEVMQYTGLHDKNGTEVYEGDICTIWIDGYKQSELYVVTDMRKLYFDMEREDSYLRISRIEVIGNIYENADLLNQ